MKTERKRNKKTFRRFVFAPPSTHYLVVLLEEPLEELMTEMAQLGRTTDRHAQPGDAE